MAPRPTGINTRTITVNMQRDLVARTDAEAERKGVSRSKVIKQALERHLRAQERRAEKR